jgi:hypothetical protein
MASRRAPLTRNEEERMNWKRAVLATIMGATLLLASPQARARCEGDIDGNNRVTVDELVRAVNNALSGCESPVSILGRYQGPGFETRMGCMNPGDEGTVAVQEITVEITGQDGSLYEGTLSLVQPGGAPLSFEIDGAVDSEGITEGMAFFSGVPDPVGQFTGRLVGDILTISARLVGTCESDAASFIGTRD